MAATHGHVSRTSGAIRLTMPAKVANDLGALQKGLKSLAERLGHPACFTGCDILHLGMEQEFSIGAERVELNPQPLPPREDFHSDPMPANTVMVSIPRSVSGNIEALTKAVAVAVGKLGCSPCCSGFDILLRSELDWIQIDENLSAKGYGKYA